MPHGSVNRIHGSISGDQIHNQAKDLSTVREHSGFLNPKESREHRLIPVMKHILRFGPRANIPLDQFLTKWQHLLRGTMHLCLK